MHEAGDRTYLVAGVGMYFLGVVGGGWVGSRTNQPRFNTLDMEFIRYNIESSYSIYPLSSKKIKLYLVVYVDTKKERNKFKINHIHPIQMDADTVPWIFGFSALLIALFIYWGMKKMANSNPYYKS